MTDQPQPILTEQITDAFGTYTAEWHCDPPPKDTRYTVIRCTWTPDHAVRRIYQIRIGDVW